MQSPVITATLVLAIMGVLIGGFVIVGELNTNELTDIRTALTLLERRLATLEDTLALLLEDNTELAEKLATEEELRLRFEEEQAQLAEGLNRQFLALAESEVTAVVSRWEQYTYRLTCHFTEEDGDEEESAGSATLERAGGDTRFLTNTHVLEEDDATLEFCNLSKPGTDLTISVDESSIVKDTERDLAYGTANVTPEVTALANQNFCTDTPTIGDNVVVLGYPSIGAEDSITVTEGVIAGFEEEFYLTSAKIEQGNSGGAVIHVADDCFLGLPTFVKRGKVESLGRILPIK